MKITKLAVNNSVSVFVFVFLLLVAGVVSYVQMPREEFPEVEIPFVIVSTPYYGVSPVDIEKLVTRPIEKEFKTLDHLKKMQSSSSESVSTIILEFHPEADIDSVLQDVRDKVDNVKRNLPDDAKEPQVMEVNSSNFPIMIANVSGNVDPVRLKKIAEDLKDDLEGDVEGLLRVDLSGAVKREIRVEPDPEKLHSFGIALNQIVGAIKSENVTLPGGAVDIDNVGYTVRVPGTFERVSEIKDIIVAVKQGKPVYLRDVALVRDTFEDRKSTSEIVTGSVGKDGKRFFQSAPNISLSLIQRGGSNLLEVVKQSKEIIKKYEEQNKGLNIVILNDASKRVNSQITTLQNSIITGLILVFLVLFFFMGGARNAILVAICIPASLFITFIVIKALGFTLNTMILFAMVLAVGLLIDNAIVVVENIYRLASQGQSNYDATINGTQQVAWPIIGGTATTLAAFFPLTLWPGVMGMFMSFLPKAVIVALLSSLFVALVINPTFSRTFLKPNRATVKDKNEVPDNFLYNSYRNAMRFALDNRIVVLGLSVLAFFGSIGLLIVSDNGILFFPKTIPEQFEVSLEMPEGTTLEETRSVLHKITEPLYKKPDLVDSWVIDSGMKAGQIPGLSPLNNHFGRVSVQLVDADKQKEDPNPWIDQLRKQYEKIPDANILVNVKSVGPPIGKALNLEIHSDDLNAMGDFARQVEAAIRGLPGVIDLTDDLDLSKPELHINVDRERAVMAGISMKDVAQFFRITLNGLDVSTFREGNDEYNITVRLPEEYRKNLNDIKNLKISNRKGVQIPVTEIAHVEFRSGTGSIHHVGVQRVVTVSAGAASGYLSDDVLKRCQEEISKLKVPVGMSISYTGQNENLAEAQAFMFKAMIAALLLIFFILVSQFNSLLQPMIIMVTVLLSFIGVFLSIVVTGMPFNVIMHGIAIISLSGIVVNNGIVLIDYINVLRADGYDRRYAIRTAGLVRMRPVLLTTATTLLSMVPMAVGVSIDFIDFDVSVGGNSVQFWQPMAIALSSGLLVATMLTLVVVPVMYSLSDDMEVWLRKRLHLPVDNSPKINPDEDTPENHPPLSTTGDEGGSEDDESKSSSASNITNTVLVLLAAAFAAFAVTFHSANAFAQSVESAVIKKSHDDLKKTNSSDFSFSVPADVEGANIELRPDISKEDLEAFTIPAKRVLTYSEAIKFANSNNLNVQKAMANVDIAQSWIRQAYSLLLPSFKAGGNVVLNQEERQVDFVKDPKVKEMAKKFGFKMEPVTVAPKWTYSWFVSAQLSANFRSISLLKQAYLRREMAKRAIDAVYEQVEIGVVQQYFALLTIQEGLKLAQEQFVSAMTTLNITEKRKSLGTATDFEITRAKLRLAQAKATGRNAKAQYLKLRASLAATVQTPADFTVVSPGVTELKMPLATIKENARKKRVSQNLFEMKSKLAREEEREMLFKYFPSFRLTFRYAGSRDVGLTPGKPMWSLIFGGEWLIWDGGSREAEWDRLEAKRVATEVEEKIAAQKLDSDLDVAYAEYEGALSEIESAETQVKLATEAVEQARKAYQFGVASQLDIVNVEDNLKSAQLALVQNKFALDLAIRKIKVLAGGHALD